VRGHARLGRPQQQGMQDDGKGQSRQELAAASIFSDKALKTHDALILYGNIMILHRRSD
jgi:hypothetical protein